MKRYVEIAHVNPGDPIEWFAGLSEEEVVRVRAEIETIETLNIKTQHVLASAIKADLAGLLRARMPGAARFRD